jgi:hypothetical protein
LLRSFVLSHYNLFAGKAFPGFIDTLVDHLDVAVMRAKTRNAKSYEEAIAFDKDIHCGHAPDPNMIEQVRKFLTSQTLV